MPFLEGHGYQLRGAPSFANLGVERHRVPPDPESTRMIVSPIRLSDAFARRLCVGSPGLDGVDVPGLEGHRPDLPARLPEERKLPYYICSLMQPPHTNPYINKSREA